MVTHVSEKFYLGTKPSLTTIDRIKGLLEWTVGGGNSLLHYLNCEEGLIVTSSSAATLLQHIQEEDILSTFYRNMIKSYTPGDLTGTLTLLSITLLLNLLSLQHTNHSTVSVTRDSIIKTCQHIKHVIQNTIKVESETLSIKNTVHLKSVIGSVIYPKLNKMLPPNKIKYLVSVILEGYISCIAPPYLPNIKIISDVGGDVWCSRFYPGLLLPHSGRRVRHQHTRSQRTSICGGTSKEKQIVVFSCMVPQELEHYEGDTVSLINSTQSLEDRFVSETIRVITEQLQTHQIAVFCCQKVVHRRVQDYLYSRGILVLERLSIRYAEEVATLAGTLLGPAITQWNVGVLEEVQYVEIGRKCYVHFTPRNESHLGTLSLTAQTHAVQAELSSVTTAALAVCNTLVNCQSVVPGSACLYSLLIARLRQEEGCGGGGESATYTTVLGTLGALCRVLSPAHVTLVTNETGHVWEVLQENSRDTLLDTACVCKKLKLNEKLDMTKHVLLAPAQYASNRHTHKQTNRHTHAQTNSVSVDGGVARVLHPTAMFTEMFEKCFQILDVLLKSELPVLI